MEHLTRATGRGLARPEAPQYCSYCGARLDPAFYFCLSCATPYKSAESVLPRPRPRRLTEGELIRLKAPEAMPLFWTFFSVVVFTALLSFLLFGHERPDLALILNAVTLTITTCVFSVRHWPSLAVQLRRFGFFHPVAWFALMLLAPLLCINYGYHSWVFETTGIDDPLLTERLKELGAGPGTLVFLYCVLPAVTEEVAFRGLLQHWLQVALSPCRALLIASALFAAMHFTTISAPYLLLVGLLLGWAKWKTGSLYPSMLIHFLHNYFVLEHFRF